MEERITSADQEALQQPPEGAEFFWKIVWEIYRHPSTESFAYYLPTISARHVLPWFFAILLLSSVVTTVTEYWVLRRTDFVMGLVGLPERWMRFAMIIFHPQGMEEWLLALIVCIIAILVLTVAAMLMVWIEVALSHLAASLLGGEGAFEQTLIVFILTATPYILVSALANGAALASWTVLSFGRCILNPLAFIVGIYVIVLESLGLAVVHDISVGKGFLATLAPIILNFVISGCLIIAFSVVTAFWIAGVH